MRKKVLVILPIIFLMTSCKPSGVRYAERLPQGTADGYVFYNGLVKANADGTGETYLVKTIDYENITYDLTDTQTTNAAYSLSEEEILVISSSFRTWKTLIFTYNYLNNIVEVITSFACASPNIYFLSRNIVSIYDSETSYVYKNRKLYTIPGYVVWVGNNEVLTIPGQIDSNRNEDRDFVYGELNDSDFVQKGSIPNPTKKFAPIVFSFEDSMNKCQIKESSTSKKAYSIDLSNWETGFSEISQSGFVKTYTSKLNRVTNGFDWPYDCGSFYSELTYAENGNELTIDFDDGKETITMPTTKKAIREVSYLKEAELIEIEYDATNVTFTYNRRTKQLTSGSCKFDSSSMSSQYQLWEDDNYRFIVQNNTYKTLGPGDYERVSFLLRENKKTNAIERMQQKGPSCKEYCYAYSFNYMEKPASISRSWF